jgi:hypothetical protein
LNKASRRAVEIAEELADGVVSAKRRAAAVRAAIEAACAAGAGFDVAADMAYKCALNDGGYAANWTVGNGPEFATEAAMVRDIVGNPFRSRSALDSGILSWNDCCVPRVAASIYAEGDFSLERMGVLADALEEAGADSVLLDHLRGPGPHVRGCRALDAAMLEAPPRHATAP